MTAWFSTDAAQMTPKDEELIALSASLDAREPVASLARKLGLSRTTVQDRLRRLE
jgi:DNA-binding Lrp family transcriptional regulator